ncbi:RNA-directed DNA polymerase, eukaryota, reverse transcriptase zinc-binding domain protein, partial [Tanacetum coccineum]
MVPLRMVGDKVVHKELGDRMERAATTASSSEAEQDSGSGPRCEDTILGDVDAQTSLINNCSFCQNNLFMNAKVVDLVIGDKWNWPRNWNMRIKDILGTQVPKINPKIDDKVVWVNKKGKVKDFCVSEVWNRIRDSSAKVIWHEHVWFTQCVPRHSFILWMAIKGKLKTQDRISSCHFTRRLWERLKIMAKLDNRLVWGATVYFIWQERNIRLFRNGGRSGEELFKVIFESVRSRLMGLKLKVTPDVINAAEVWKFPIDKMYSFSPETYGNSLEFMVSSKAAIQGFACEGFLTRQGSWVIIYLMFILFMDCTRGMDNGWHRYGSMSSCLSIADDYASLLIYSLIEFYSSTKFVYASSLNVVLIDELTLAQTLIEIKAAKPKVVTTAATTTTTTRPKGKGVVVQEPSEFRVPQESQPLISKDKGKGIMVEPKVPLKRTDQIALDEQ